jgi:molybdopterin molybdotransferase
MEQHLAIGFDEALAATLDRVVPLEAETIDLSESVDRVVAEEMLARIDSPSVDASMKDGYAVVSADVAAATPDRPVRLRLLGCAAAGGRRDLRVEPSTTVRVLTGAKIPDGADAVVSGEFARAEDDHVVFLADAGPGRNILPRGTDIARGGRIVDTGARLTPGTVGLLAAAGHGRVAVVRSPRVSVVATGDEIVAPGRPLPEGKLYASNMMTLVAWCRRYGIRARTAIVGDDADALLAALAATVQDADAVLTSGGAWTSDRDVVARVLDRLGWERVFHRIRIGPGKAVGFGTLAKKPIFLLPGGPPSNLMGFLQIALPALMRLAGHARPGLPRSRVRLAADLRGSHADWTQFISGTIEATDELPRFHPLRGESRLRSLAEAEAIVAIPEGHTLLPAGSVVRAQRLDPGAGDPTPPRSRPA